MARVDKLKIAKFLFINLFRDHLMTFFKAIKQQCIELHNILLNLSFLLC
jgi:hypothetical protein